MSANGGNPQYEPLSEHGILTHLMRCGTWVQKHELKIDRTLNRLVNSKQCKICNVSTPFLCPTVSMQAHSQYGDRHGCQRPTSLTERPHGQTKSSTCNKKVTYVTYRMNVTVNNEQINQLLTKKKVNEIISENKLIPLFTSFELWNFIITNQGKSDSELATHLYFLFPKWSEREWLDVITCLTNSFRQTVTSTDAEQRGRKSRTKNTHSTTNNSYNNLKTEMKRIENYYNDKTQQGCIFPWWKDDPSISRAHSEIEYKIKEYMSNPKSPIIAPIGISHSEHKTQHKHVIPYNDHIYIPLSDDTPHSTRIKLIQLSNCLYGHFNENVSLAEIQHSIIKHNFNVDLAKKHIDKTCSSVSSESFPTILTQLKELCNTFNIHADNYQLFKMWQQSRGEMDMIRKIFEQIESHQPHQPHQPHQSHQSHQPNQSHQSNQPHQSNCISNDCTPCIKFHDPHLLIL